MSSPAQTLLNFRHFLLLKKVNDAVDLVLKLPTDIYGYFFEPFLKIYFLLSSKPKKKIKDKRCLTTKPPRISYFEFENFWGKKNIGLPTTSFLMGPVRLTMQKLLTYFF